MTSSVVRSLVCALVLLLGTAATAQTPKMAKAPADRSSGDNLIATDVPFIATDTPAWVVEARRDAANRKYAGVGLQANGQLRPRTPIAKTPTGRIEVPAARTGRLMVKFNDDVQARVRNGQVVSLAGVDLSAVNELLANHAITAAPMFKKSAERLSMIESRAAALSGDAQPDLGGMIVFNNPGGISLAAAGAFNELGMIEFVEFERQLVQAYSMGLSGCCIPGTFSCVDLDEAACLTQGGVVQPNLCTGALCGACCLADGTCLGDRDSVACVGAGGTYDGDGSSCQGQCVDTTMLDCGDPAAGDCFNPTTNVTPYCDIEPCCDDVCSFDPFCCDINIVQPGRGVGTWDEWCADHALEICQGVIGGGPGLAGPAYPGNAPTPNLADAQGYLTLAQWGGGAAMLPLNINTALRYQAGGNVSIMDGYTGEGYDLETLWDVGEILLNSSGLTPNRTRGFGIKIGVLDVSAFVATASGPDAPYSHEDLVVFPEPGITPLIIPQLQSFTGHHGTAALCVIGATDNTLAGVPRPPAASAPSASIADQLGMVGIAADSSLFFFPTVSAQEPAGRIEDAMSSAIEAFGPGDILALPFTQGGLFTGGGVGNILTNLATSVGITVVIPAGNNCNDIGGVDEAEPLGATGAIVVGATYPGCDGADGIPATILGPPFPPTGFNCYCRFPVSNYGDRTNISGWGDAVATLSLMGSSGAISPTVPPTGLALGFKPVLFQGNVAGNPSLSRTYTNAWGDTSAAVAQVAGLTACMQGLALQMFDDGTTLGAAQIRGVVSGSGTLQCGNNNPRGGPSEPPNGPDCPLPSNPLGGSPTQSNGDWTEGDDIASVGGPNPPGVVHTDTALAADSLLTTDWFDGNEELQDIVILEGEHHSGSVLAIKTPSDGIRLVVGSVGSIPTGPGISVRGNLGSGKVTDVLIRGDSLGAAPASELTLAVQTTVTAGSGIMIAYIYNWDLGHWQVAGVTFLIGDEDDPGTNGTIVPFTIANGSSFVSTTGQVEVRLWTIANGLSPDYLVLHDYVAFEFSGNDFVPGGPPP